MKPKKYQRYDLESAMLVLEIAFYQAGSLDSLKEMQAGNDAVRACVQKLIDDKRVSAGQRIYIASIQKAPNPISMITEAWAQFHFARAEEKALVATMARLTSRENEPDDLPVQKKKKGKKTIPVVVDPNKPLTRAGVSSMKEALRKKQEALEAKQKVRAPRRKEATEFEHGIIVVDEMHCELSETTFAQVLDKLLPTQATA